MDLWLEDTLSGRPMPVRPSRGRTVRMYVCGPTVYDGAHVGHGRTYLYFDLARRWLESEGRGVRYVMNVTDVEDKIDRRAAALGIGWRTLVRREEHSFFRDLGDLGIRLPDRLTRASEYVPEMARLARALARTGRVHRSGDEWTYEAPERARGANFPTGADLAAHAVAERDRPFPGATGADRSFMVWKRQDPPLPSWPGPWGRGVPGWHLECVAMARDSLGLPVDLHGGGRDLIYPHHYAENETTLALSRRRFSRVFFHSAFVLQGGRKMSKSVGNLVRLRAALEEVGPSALRWYLLSRPSARSLPWDPRELSLAAREYSRIRAAIRSWLSSGAGGRRGAGPAQRLAEAVRGDLAGGLRVERSFARIRRFAEQLERDPSGTVARGERPVARMALSAIEARTGLVLS